MVNEQIQRNISTLKTTTSLVIYVVLAIISVIIVYPMYKLIMALPNISTWLQVTAPILFFLIVYFVLYMGTNWVYKGEMKI